MQGRVRRQGSTRRRRTNTRCSMLQFLDDLSGTVWHEFGDSFGWLHAGEATDELTKCPYGIRFRISCRVIVYEIQDKIKEGL